MIKTTTFFFIFFSIISCGKKKTDNVIYPKNEVSDTVATGESLKIKIDTITHISKPFMLNGISLYWEKHIIMVNENLSDIYIDLKNYKTKQLMLETQSVYEDSINNSDNYYVKLNKQCFEDYNFDGFKDASFYSRGSMAMTSSTNIYLFNLKTKSFDVSEELSATVVDVDKKKQDTHCDKF